MNQCAIFSSFMLDEVVHVLVEGGTRVIYGIEQRPIPLEGVQETTPQIGAMRVHELSSGLIKQWTR
jgi:hypothetical protein